MTILWTPQDRIGVLGGGMQVHARAMDVAAAFVPTDIASIRLWLAMRDATTVYTDSGVTLVSSDGDVIGQVSDKSGQGNHYRQTTTGNKPLWKTNIQNGQSIGRADGTDDFLTKVNTLSLTNLTICAVVKAAASAVDPILGSASNNHFFLNSNSYIQFQAPGNAYATVTYGTGFQVLTVTRTAGSTIAIWRNGASVSLASNPNQTDALVIDRIFDNGAGSFFGGDIGEIVVFNEVLSAGNIASMHTYLNGIWSIY